MRAKRIIWLGLTAGILFHACLALAQQSQSDYQRNRMEPHKNTPAHDFIDASAVHPGLLQWIRANVSEATGLPQSFGILPEEREGIFKRMGKANSVEGIIERTIVEEGLVIYDGAASQITLAVLGDDDDLPAMMRPIEVYWDGGVGDLFNIRAGYPISNFIYDPADPELVSSNMNHKGKRGFIFRIINAHGKYLTEDPLDGKKYFEGFPVWPRIHWEDWKPVAGENGWVAMACMHVYHKKYYSPTWNDYTFNPDSIALKLAEELARAALLLQADNGGIRMAPLGAYMKPGEQKAVWYNLISTENNISWYAAFRMLYQVTGKDEYRQALIKMDHYFKEVWDSEEGFLYQGMYFVNGRWHPEKGHFATDCQTWAILTLGCEKIDEFFGYGAAYSMWKSSKEKSGVFSASGELLGVGFTTEHDRLSVEWTAGAIAAARDVAKHYEPTSSMIAREAREDAGQMRQGIESLKTDYPDGRRAYSYSSRRGWIPFGWFSHEPGVLSMASTTWVALIDANVNPFLLPGVNHQTREVQFADSSP